MNGLTELGEALNAAPILAEIDTYNDGVADVPALFEDDHVPGYFTGQKSINYYNSEVVDYSGHSLTSRGIVACRAATFSESQQIAAAVINEINRKTYSNYMITCSLLPTIPPKNSQDNYNTQVVTNLRKRGF